MKEVLIDRSNSNQRIDKFVRRYLNDAPLSFIYKHFRKKNIKVNGKRVEQSYILQDGDLVRMYITDEQIAEFNNPKKIEDLKFKLDIIYEDENILIVNKPKGILVHGDINEVKRTLSNQVIAYLYTKGEYKNDGQSFIPSPCHRLDRNTSGLVVFAKNVNSSQVMMDLFKAHDQLEKTYILLVDGRTDKSGRITAPLIKDADDSFVKVGSINEGAKEAITDYETVSSNGKFSVVKATLRTGRTHQLRVHFQYIKHPILGDQKYGNFKLNKEFEKEFNYKSQFLHAYSLKLSGNLKNLAYLEGKTFKAKLGKTEEEILRSLDLKY